MAYYVYYSNDAWKETKKLVVVFSSRKSYLSFEKNYNNDYFFNEPISSGIDFAKANFTVDGRGKKYKWIKGYNSKEFYNKLKKELKW